MEPEIGSAPLVRDRDDDDLVFAGLIDDAVGKPTSQHAPRVCKVRTAGVRVFDDFIERAFYLGDELVTETRGLAVVALDRTA